MRTFRILLALSVWPILLLAQSTPEQIAYALSTRYTPYFDGAARLDLEEVAAQKVEAWWSSPAERRVLGQELSAAPLAGLHLALDPGHVGGFWAKWEWRNFRISEQDYWVREGELVLEVAQRVRAELTRLGAQVTLLRESSQPINPETFADYWPAVAAQRTPPSEVNLQIQLQHAMAVRDAAIRMAIVSGELAERARVVNEQIRPDALLSLHINAAAWPEGDTQQLVQSDHTHVLVFGCLSEAELLSSEHQAQLIEKLINGSGPIEATLGAALGAALGEATGLPASDYQGDNAIRIDAEVPYLWARNLMLLRLVKCPTVLLEPYVANSEREYARIQAALNARAHHQPLPADDILLEYTSAVVEGVMQAYGTLQADGEVQ
ncbi:N-acetylmuramoyl-L-alanine amidase [Coraliomargarita algicola]|uniref:N-acetylmuramoyl-L-alanine amidase n=1 Tax=Coraliomargarita algicola TaxID=3092156 RepID=A0ABZ0RK07_9BACT|nr:N-acetylmuramoyl-L-alanine amidase [Coraliomargarita sp. J2-16]WPJ95438.1 N-acetylmuramoyl-L-alanine amidase [Coraliomargarita sp. J2-16]